MFLLQVRLNKVHYCFVININEIYNSYSLGKLLEPSDFNGVTEDLWEVRDRYFLLGTALGLQPVDIEAIRGSRMEQVDSCFQEVIKQCIDRGLYQGDIVRALESIKLCCIPLAQKLREKYKVMIDLVPFVLFIF